MKYVDYGDQFHNTIQFRNIFIHLPEMQRLLNASKIDNVVNGGGPSIIRIECDQYS